MFPHSRRLLRWSWLLFLLSGCTSLPDYIHNGFKVGPNYKTPSAPTANDWIDASDKRVRKESDDLSKWWTVFNDPILDDLICAAYKQNLTLREAGYRIMQARALYGVAFGSMFPQTQQANADYATTAISGESANGRINPHRVFSQYQFGFNLAWEVDFWGKYRRAVESARANLDASVYDYDDVLVTLLSDVATAYVNMRVTEERIKYAQENAKLQDKTWKIALARVNADNDGELSVDQARALLRQTEATIPEFEIGLRTTITQLCVLLGMPPEDLQKRLGAAKIPVAPPEVAVGIPADLVRRRPDVRRAERQAAAQSALIGVAEADFYPQISLVGNLGYQAQFFKDLFGLPAFAGSVGPSIQWDVLNYGRIINNVRYQDAKFKELVAAYQQSVLTAGQEAENGLVTFLKAQLRTKLQQESAEYARKGEKNVRGRYELGLENFTRVTQLQQLLVQEEDLLAQAQGEIALGLILTYKALGGGWQIRRDGCGPPRLFPEAGEVSPAVDNVRMPHRAAAFGRPE
jgi:NodT family efflux transporter outer membrane factor (OMF) lipoprotein